MEQLKNLLADVAFTDKDRVIEILEAEGIDDLETLRAASEDDLRKASLKMGDIIKIRMLLENQISRSSKELDSSRSSISSAEDDQNLNDTKKDDKSSEVIKVKNVNAQGIDNDTSYNAQAMLQKCLPRTKCTIAQTYFRNLLRDCAREARIWQKAYTISLIPDVKLHKFFELVFAAAPQLAGHKAEVKRRLGQALQNRRKYESDIKAGKRTTKKKSSPSKEKKDVAHTSNSIEKTIVGFLQKQSPERRTSSPANIEKSEGPRVLFTGIIPSDISRLTEIICNLGGVVVSSVKECTHLITRKILRTVEFLCAISVVKYVVTPDWIEKSQQSKEFLDPSEFTVKDACSENIYDMDLKTSLQRARTRPLLKDILVYVTQNVEPSPSSMKEIIQCAGGQVLPSVPPQKQLAELKLKTMEQGSPVLLVISCDKDFQLCSEFIRKGFDIHNAELILSGVLKQHLDLDLYKL